MDSGATQDMAMKILLVGDDGRDVYHLGDVTRLSPEAPVPVFVLVEEKTKPGMAGNVRENLLALDCSVTYLHGKTSTKTRFIDRTSRQHLMRIDQDQMSDPVKLDINLSEFDAIVVSDYNKGTVDYEILEEIKRSGKPVFIDTKKTDLARFNDCFVKINAKEYLEAVTYNNDLIVTYGAQGASYKNKHFPTRSIEVTDVCGAGDTFLAALCVEYLRTSDIELAIEFAIRASTVTVTHIGAYAPTRVEIDAIAR